MTLEAQEKEIYQRMLLKKWMKKMTKALDHSQQKLMVQSNHWYSSMDVHDDYLKKKEVV